MSDEVFDPEKVRSYSVSGWDRTVVDKADYDKLLALYRQLQSDFVTGQTSVPDQMSAAMRRPF